MERPLRGTGGSASRRPATVQLSGARTRGHGTRCAGIILIQKSLRAPPPCVRIGCFFVVDHAFSKRAAGNRFPLALQPVHFFQKLALPPVARFREKIGIFRKQKFMKRQIDLMSRIVPIKSAFFSLGNNRVRQGRKRGKFRTGKNDLV